MWRWKQRVVRWQPIAVVLTLRPYIQPERQRLLFVATLALLLTGIEVGTPYLVGAFADSIRGGLETGATTGLPWTDQWGLVGLLIGAGLLRGLLSAVQRGQTGRIGNNVATRLRESFWSHLALVPLAHVQDRGTGRLLLRFIGDARSVQRFVTEGLVRIGQDVLLLVAVVVALVWLNWRMALAVLAMLPVFGVLFWRLNPALRQASLATRNQRARLSAYVGERVGGMKAVKAFARERAENARVARLSRGVAERGAHQAAVGGWLEGATAAIVACGSALVLLVAAEEAGAGRLTVGTFVTFLILIGLLPPVFRRIATANRVLQEACVSMTRLNATLSVPPESPDDRNRPRLKIRKGALSVEEASFRYGEGRRALKGVSLQARRGELTVLTGPNGSGKTTLLDLIPRFSPLARGRILIDGQDVATLSLASLRSQIGLVSLDMPLFSGSVRENVVYGLRRAPDERRLAEVARLSGLDGVLRRRQDGWETQVGPGGQALSDGQRQRVALARALAIDPPILLLDEPAAALDAESEQTLAAGLRELARTKTVVVVAHSLPTLRAADCIYVMQRGRVVEQGTHERLIREGKLYRRLFEDEEAQSPARNAWDGVAMRSSST
jgi:ABC-type multidrug transport system fused ATPase/permease subunit